MKYGKSDRRRAFSLSPKREVRMLKKVNCFDIFSLYF